MLEGRIRIPESHLNDLLASVVPKGRSLQIQSNNRIVARVGVLQATVILPPHSDLSRAPELVFTLASLGLAWTLRYVLKQAYLQVHGRQIMVNLAAVPGLDEYRAMLRHVTSLDITTETGVLIVRFRLSIA